MNTEKSKQKSNCNEGCRTIAQGVQLLQRNGELLVQEIIPGDNQCFYKVATFYDDQMKLMGLFSLQRTINSLLILAQGLTSSANGFLI